MKPRTSTEVVLYVIHDDCSPNEITKILGICPTATWKRGEPIPGTKNGIHKRNCWKLSSPLSSTADSEKQIAALLRRISRAIPKFKNLPKGATVDLLIDVRAHDDSQRTMEISQEAIQALARIKAVLSFEYYDYRVNDEDAETGTF